MRYNPEPNEQKPEWMGTANVILGFGGILLALFLIFFLSGCASTLKYNGHPVTWNGKALKRGEHPSLILHYAIIGGQMYHAVERTCELEPDHWGVRDDGSYGYLGDNPQHPAMEFEMDKIDEIEHRNPIGDT
jgi:hypothetical protein